MSADASPDRPRRLAAVVVNHKTPADTALAVRSLLASERGLDAIVVVDNDSTADLRATARTWGERVQYAHTGRNLGFAGGANVGVRAALDGGADAVFLLNSDAMKSAIGAGVKNWPSSRWRSASCFARGAISSVVRIDINGQIVGKVGRGATHVH